MEERIDLEIQDHGIWSFLPPVTSPELLTDIRSMLLVPLAEGNAHPWADPRSGCVCLVQPHAGGWWKFPRGLKDSLLPRLQARGLGIRWHPDARWPQHYDPSGFDEVSGRLLHDPQRWAANGLWQHRDGIAALHTRFGKSYTTAAGWVGAGRPIAIMTIPRTAIAKQVQEELSDFLGEQVGVVCNSISKPDIRRFTVVSLKSLIDGGWIRPEYQPWLASVEAVYIDEGHIAGDQMFLLHLATQNRIIQWAMTATPFVNDDLKDSMLVAFTGPVRLQMKAKHGADLGLIAQLQIRWYDLYYPPTMAKAVNAADYYTQAVVDNDFRNGMIAWIAQHHLNHGDSVLIFVERVAHGKKLAAMIPGAVANVGNVTEKKKQKFKADFNSGQVKCVIVTKRWREGVTVAADVCINAEGLKSDHVQIQKLGRGLMPKADGRPLIFYDLNDKDCGTLERWASLRASAYRNEGWPQENIGKMESGAPIF